MFDTRKIQRMTTLLEKLPKKFNDIYLIVEKRFTAETVALFKRLKISIRAIIHDETLQKELWGIPFVKTADVSETFNEYTALIIIPEKSLPLLQTTFDFKSPNGGGIKTVSAVIMSVDEIEVIYDRLMVDKLIQMYCEDGMFKPNEFSVYLSLRFARGLTAMLPNSASIKFSFHDYRWFFKPTYNFDDTAIVIQGPIAYDNDYTAETFKLYRSIYPNIPIVVSTWKNEATNSFRKECAEHSIILLENEPPKEHGDFNINMQLESSLQGVKFVKAHTSAKFVLKTRTDQRINRFDFLVYFKNLLETFPPKDDKLNQRIIFLSVTKLTQFPFYYQDYLSFGHVEDISKLYSITYYRGASDMSYSYRHFSRMRKFVDKVLNERYSLDYDSASTKNFEHCKIKRWAHKFCFPEMYISKTFYKQHIAPIDETKLPETSWKFAAEYLILIDPEAILMDWFKYETVRYKAFNNLGGHSAFSRWLDMYRNFKIDRV